MSAPAAPAEPVSPHPARRRLTFHQLQVAEIDRLADDAVSITFAVPEQLRDEFAFAPGQHVTLRARQVDDQRRNYSICSPAGSGVLRIGVKRLPGGAFSGYALDQIAPGDQIEVMAPTGSFSTRLDPARARHYCAIAAGSGITPILSIITSALATEPGSRVTLLYGNRTTSSIMFLEELADLKDRYPRRFNLVHVLSREPHEVELFHGRLDPDRLTRFVDALVPPGTVDEWFLCGPFAMVQAARATLLDHGAARTSIHVELFHVDGQAPPPAAPTTATTTAADAAPADARQVTVILDGRSSTFPLAETAESVLDATLKVRSDAPFACKGGVCGTCRARLVRGTVRMDQNYALEPDELESGFVLACQSHPTADQVTLDFDH